jgi:hypothetical protein
MGQAGLGAIAVIIALLITALLYLGYVSTQSATTELKRTVSAVDNSKAFACKTNRQTLEREIQMWLVNHPGEPPSFAALQADGGGRATCPEGGTYAVDGMRVGCSKHD